MDECKMSLLIGICGRTGSGKTSAAKHIDESLRGDGISVGVFSMDDYYRELTDEEHIRALENKHDFDCLESFELQLLKTAIETAKKGEVVRFRTYDHANHKHSTDYEERGPFDVVVFEGLYLFSDRAVAECFDLKIYMEVDPDVSLMRRIRRDVVKRRRTTPRVLDQYERYVKPAYEKLVAPSKMWADIIIPRGAHNKLGMESVLSFIRRRQ